MELESMHYQSFLENNLGFVVIDEQHRFGVNQRQKLLSKSNNPNLMAMTATPIPRTLAITYNGDMDLSIIDELPKNRPDIHTSFIEKENLSTAFNFIREKEFFEKFFEVTINLVSLHRPRNFLEDNKIVDTNLKKNIQTIQKKINVPTKKPNKEIRRKFKRI